MRIATKSVVVGVVSLVILLSGLSGYGMNEDSPFHFLRGQAYLHLLTTGRKVFDQPRLPSPVLFVPGQRISAYKFNAWEDNLSAVKPIATFPSGDSTQAIYKRFWILSGKTTFYKHNAWSGGYFQASEGPGHPPISDIFSALTNKIFHEKLALVGDVEGYHLWVVIWSAVLIGAIFAFSSWRWGTVAGSVSALTLIFYPLFFAESHFNIKDIPEAAFFGLSLMAFFCWFETRKARWLVIFTFTLLFALGTKLNALFIFPILVIWFLTLVQKKVFLKKLSLKSGVGLGASLVVVGFGFVALWPYLWDDPISKTRGVLEFYLNVGRKDLRVELPASFSFLGDVSLEGVLMVLGTTPPIVFLLVAVGLLTVVLRKLPKFDSNPEFLVLLWLFIPIVRTLIPGATVLGSTRQFIEFLPALAIVAGWGASFITKKLKMSFVILGSLIYGLYLVVIISFYHPNENVYYNFLVGGPSGALNSRLLDWQTSYDNPYRQAVEWLNINASNGAHLAYLDGTMQAISSEWLRTDIHFDSSFSGFGQKGEYVVTIVYPHPPAVFPYLYLERFLEPIYVVRAGGVDLIRIYRNSPDLIKTEVKQQRVVLVGEVSYGSDNLGSFWEIPLRGTESLVSLSTRWAKGDCAVSEGVFLLDDYFVPWRIDGERVSEFLFPAERTKRIRYYPLASNSCLEKPLGVEVKVL